MLAFRCFELLIFAVCTFLLAFDTGYHLHTQAVTCHHITLARFGLDGGVFCCKLKPLDFQLLAIAIVVVQMYCSCHVCMHHDAKFLLSKHSLAFQRRILSTSFGHYLHSLGLCAASAHRHIIE
jgi:hypothetical protein